MQPPSEQRPTIRIADIDDIEGMTRVQALETEVWGLDPIDVLPITMHVATRAAGATLVGAFDGPALVGFVYGFPGIERGRATIHSHMLAVKSEYRDQDLGYRLKLAQRDRALALGVSEVTWTFDPLQSRNAHFNFAKLAVLSDTYKIDFYGTSSSSYLHRTSTDRLWVRWFVSSGRVVERLGATGAAGPEPAGLGDAVTLVDADALGAPRRAAASDALGRDRALIRVPADFNAVQGEDAALAARWREVTRSAFAEAFAAGYVAEAFLRPERGGPPMGSYVLRRGRLSDFA